MSQSIVRYTQIEKDFFHSLLREFKEDLLLYCVTGGFGLGKVIDGWSDVDILLVFDCVFDQSFFERFSALIRRDTPIKLGVTFFTLSEFQDRVSKDSKTLHAISLIKNRAYVPRIINKKIQLQDIVNRSGLSRPSLWINRRDPRAARNKLMLVINH